MFKKIKKFFKRKRNANKDDNSSKIENKDVSIFEDELLEKYGEIDEIKKFNLKILFITDTHNSLKYDSKLLEMLNNIKDYDYCILLGDHSAYDLIEILKVIPIEKICGVLGNHDSIDKYSEYGINNLNGKVIEINNVRIAGISGSFKYKNTEVFTDKIL